jgi:KaiC/GvpD/RAD55 family RecA-like ATPase/CheY-like chemotaxis protein
MRYGELRPPVHLFLGDPGDNTMKAMEYAAKSRISVSEGQMDRKLRVISDDGAGRTGVPSGISALDQRLGGLEPGGVYLLSGTPGPAKLVAILQFLHAGIARGERVFLLTSVEAAGLLEVARAWGFALDRAWEQGDLEILGFREDFEMRVLRSTEPEDVLEELARLVPRDVTRIAVDPGSMFLQGGSRTLLGRTFLDWARKHPGTVCTTLSIDTTVTLPSSAEWLVHATSGVFLIDRRSDGLFQVQLNRSIPGSKGSDDPVTLQLVPGVGLIEPDRVPLRRSSDRPAGASDQVLLVSLGDPSATDLENWARGAFTTEVVTEPLDAVTRLQGGSPFGCVLIHAPRQRLREAQQVCRAVRPLTGAAVVFVSDDAVRSTDRVNLLEAGADDCLSGGADFRELATRIQQAAVVGGKPPAPAEVVRPDSGSPRGGLVPPELFKGEAERRASDRTLSVFGLLRLSSPGVPIADLENALSAEIRDEDGDLVTRAVGACLVLLQGARGEAAQAFLSRVKASLERRFGRDPAFRATVLIHPAEKGQIGVILGHLIGTEADRPGPADPGGSSGREV